MKKHASTALVSQKQQTTVRWVLVLWDEVVVETSWRKSITYFASTVIYLGPHGLAAVAWLGFDSDHGQLSWQLDHLWLVITESFPLHYFSVFICWMLTHWAFIFFTVPETLEDMSSLIATDLWAHGPVAWKAQRTAIKQQQRLKDAYPALSADLLSILFTESTKFLCQFIFFSFHFYFLCFFGNFKCCRKSSSSSVSLWWKSQHLCRDKVKNGETMSKSKFLSGFHGRELFIRPPTLHIIEHYT